MSTTTLLGLIGGVAALTALIKASGPVALGSRELPRGFTAVVAMLAPALFSALVVTQVLADGRALHVGADTAGVALAGVALWRGVPMVAAVVIAAVATALLRAVA